MFWMPFLIMDMTTFFKFGLILSSDIRVLNKKWKYGIVVEHYIQFNKGFIYV